MTQEFPPGPLANHQDTCRNVFYGYLDIQRPVDRWRMPDAVVVFVLFTALVGLYFLPLLGESRILSSPKGDVAYYWYWNRGFLGEALRRVHIPFWNPYIMSGTPFLASGQSAIFYPLNWLFAVAPVGAMLNIQTIFHFWLGLTAAYLMTRRIGTSVWASFISALVFGFSGFAILHWWQGHFVFVVEWPWTALAVWAWVSLQENAGRRPASFERPSRGLLASPHSRATVRAFCCLSACLAMQIFGGHPQIPYFSLLILATLQAGWLVYAYRNRVLSVGLKGAGWTSAAVAAGLLLASVHLLPMAMYSGETIRGGKAERDYYEGQSQPLTNMVTIVAPWAWGGRPGGSYYVGAETYWEVVAFVGMTTFLLALAGFMVFRATTGLQWTLAALLGGAWWLAAGHYGRGYRLLFDLLPGLSFFRCPGRILFIVTFAFALLSAISMDRMVRWATERRREFLITLRRGGIALAAALVAFVVFFTGGAQGPLFTRLLTSRIPGVESRWVVTEEAPKLYEQFSWSCYAAFGIGGAAIAALGLIWLPRFRLVGKGFVCGLVLFELAQFARPYRESFCITDIEWPEKTQRLMAEAMGRYRITSAREPGDLSQGMEHGFRHVWGYDPGGPFQYMKAIGISQKIERYPHAWEPVSVIGPLTNALGMRYLIAPPGKRPVDRRWIALDETGGWPLFENLEALPRGITVAQVEVSQDAFMAVSSDDFQPTRTVLLDEPPPAGFAAEDQTTAPGTVRIVLDDPERFEAKVSMEHNGWFVLMDQMLPGWKAMVDGKEAKIYRANAVGRALPLRVGTHRIVMTYDAPGFRTGALVSSIAWTLWFALLCIGFATCSHKPNLSLSTAGDSVP